MKEQTCEGCGDVYKKMSYAEELKPENLCPVCTVKYLYERYRLNVENRNDKPIAPYYGVSTGKLVRAIQTYPKEVSLA